MRWFLVTDELTPRDKVKCVRHACGTIGFLDVRRFGPIIIIGPVSDVAGNILDPQPDVRPACEYPYPEDDKEDRLSEYWRD